MSSPCLAITIGSFNPRPREGGDELERILEVILVLFQSTPPRRGRRCVRFRGERDRIVSIHAPAKGATCCRTCGGFASCLFQSTPPRRGRLIILARSNHVNKSFNPRPREGGDFRCIRRIPARVDVSIHAPAKGATFVRYVVASVGNCFNPRPREGGDIHSIDAAITILRVSIHAPAKGATIVHRPSRPRIHMFQSTPPRRGRLVACHQ